MLFKGVASIKQGGELNLSLKYVDLIYTQTQVLYKGPDSTGDNTLPYVILKFTNSWPFPCLMFALDGYKSSKLCTRVRIKLELAS